MKYSKLYFYILVGFMAYQPLLVIKCQILSFFIHIIYMVYKHILYIDTVKLPNISISNNSIEHKSAKLNGSKYCDVLLTIQSFVYLQLNDQTVLFQTIQFSVHHLFALNLKVQQIYLIHR